MIHMPTLNEADTHFQEGQVDVAIQIYQEILAQNPSAVGAIKGLARCAESLGLARQAEDAWQQVITINPKDLDGLMRKGLSYQRVGQYSNAIKCFSEVISRSSEPLVAHRARLQCLLYSDKASVADREAAQHALAEFYAARRAPPRVFANDKNPIRRLRIGYCSSDFHAHPVGMAILPLLHFHNRDAVEVYSYADVPNQDGATEQIKGLCDWWRDIAGMHDDAAAELIVQDEIDILVVLAGHMDRNRLFIGRTRPAPIQVLHHGQCSSFISDYDYFIGDRIITPHGGSEQFSERILRLPCWTVQAFPAEAEAVKPPPFACNGYITFGSFNNPIKLNETTLSLWTGIMCNVPNSRLYLKYYDLYGVSEVRDRIVGFFETAGIGSERLMFKSDTDARSGHLSHYGQVDIALDPAPFNGATTTFEALLMGVPVISLLGQQLLARSAASLITTAGLSELIGHCPDEYEKIAVSLATDYERLSSIRFDLRAKIKASALFDARRYARNMERFYRAMWHVWCDENR
tara:strand:+ start:9222 stop:10778 length:1557 start_codon:yes stop_codon:yes gene_type:complete